MELPKCLLVQSNDSFYIAPPWSSDCSPRHAEVGMSEMVNEVLGRDRGQFEGISCDAKSNLF